MNTTVIVELYVPPGLAFLKWLGAFSGSTAPALQFTLDGPKVLQPVFAIADAITLNTSPPNLQVTADGLTFFAPVTYYWAEGSQHTVGAPGPSAIKSGASGPSVPGATEAPSTTPTRLRRGGGPSR